MENRGKKKRRGRSAWVGRRGRERCGKRESVESVIWLLMIHAVTHGAIHSLCSCAGHMRNMISQHLPPPWKFFFWIFFLHAAPSPSPLLSICPDAVLTDRQVKSLVTCLWLTVASVGWQGLTKRPRQSSVYETFSAAAAAIITYRSFILPSLATARYTHAPVTQRSFSAPVLDFCPKVCVCL